MYIFGILKKWDEAKIKIAQILLSAIFFSRTPKHFYHSITMLLHVLWQNELVFQAYKSNINGLVFVCVSYHLEIINLVKNKNHKWNDEWKLTLICKPKSWLSRKFAKVERNNAAWWHFRNGMLGLFLLMIWI